MSEYTYHLGDLVVEKSGGAPMTVTDILKLSGTFNYTTVWLQDGQQQVGSFPEDELDAAPPGSSSPDPVLSRDLKDTPNPAN